MGKPKLELQSDLSGRRRGVHKSVRHFPTALGVLTLGAVSLLLVILSPFGSWTGIVILSLLVIALVVWIARAEH